MQPAPFRIGHDPLTLEALVAVARHGQRVELAEAARERISRSRAVVDHLTAAGDAAPSVYGINTGFGFLADVRIGAAEIRELQRNLIRSHAAGVGPLLPVPVVRAMMLLRTLTLSLGHSGTRLVVAERLCELLNKRLHPCVPCRGSVGASGDLAPLAHLTLALLGEGEMQVDWPAAPRTRPAAEVLRDHGIEPLVLQAKEGLALVNGTQCMTALGALALSDALDACRIADLAGAMSLEALQGTPRAFDPRIHAARPHPGQSVVAANLRALLAGSAIVESHKNCGKVQDPYSLRCMPQVHGATRDALAYSHEVLLREAISATDNPLIFCSPGAQDGARPEFDIISGGNFHGQPVALALDFAGIAVAELANISERRIEQLVNPHLSGLPAFLTPHSGLNSGYMIAQVTAAALVSDNKILAHPASVDSIPSSAGREDHVSMGVHAADKLARIVDNVRNVLAIELCCAAQGLHLRMPLRPGPALQAVYSTIREVIPPLSADRVLHEEITAMRSLCDRGAIQSAAQGHIELR
jgi:histidine ammonia-lyase